MSRLPIAGTGVQALALACVALPLFAMCISNPAAAEEKVSSLHYGAGLFHFYQSEYFDALTELMVGAEKNELRSHTTSAPLLSGGIALSYGMDRQAELIFRNILASPENHRDHDRAWFYLGKTAWQRGLSQRAAGLFARVADSKDEKIREEARYLQSVALLSTGERSGADALFNALPDTSRWRQYLAYNLGAERARVGDWVAALWYFGPFTAQGRYSREDAALRDKGLTAAGFAYLASGEPVMAQQAFREVRSESLMAERALLGYGWSASAQGDFQAALSPWQALGEKSTLSSSTREGLLALPYAYAQLGRPGLALEHYGKASAAYLSQLEGLRVALQRFRSEPLARLLGFADARAQDWAFNVDILPVSSEASYLEHLLTQHGFQISLRELRDLYQIESRLEQAQERLQVLTEVDTHQQRSWAAVVEEKQRDLLAARRQQLMQQLQTLRTQLERAAAQGDGRMLADAEQTARWARLQRAQSVAARIDSDGAYSDRLRLLTGMMKWRDSEAYPAHLWRARREMRSLEALAVQSTDALQRLDAAIADKRQSNFTARIDTLKERVALQQRQCQDTIAMAEGDLRQVAIAELELQSQQLQKALGQSELAIAQLYDQGLEGVQ